MGLTVTFKDLTVILVSLETGRTQLVIMMIQLFRFVSLSSKIECKSRRSTVFMLRVIRKTLRFIKNFIEHLRIVTKGFGVSMRVRPLVTDLDLAEVNIHFFELVYTDFCMRFTTRRTSVLFGERRTNFNRCKTTLNCPEP